MAVGVTPVVLGSDLCKEVVIIPLHTQLKNFTYCTLVPPPQLLGVVAIHHLPPSVL